ncbi:MAG: uracil-DNA glycosylase [Elusimicrobia bacterium CG08_land_8_20_14_0_20_59_10]|nr:MAG: uracil-DNA glycosylase [Elusimicrobia bacterium CG08_land_8_20_14_0_20_59_10]
MKRELAAAAGDLASYIRTLDETLAESPRPAAETSAPVPAPLPAKKNVPPMNSISSADMDKLSEQVKKCRKCGLGHARLNAVFGVGSHKARVVFVGEGPGFQEDHRGEPFVGRSGQLLDKILDAVLHLKRSEVYIANIVKCHPMRNPETPEAHGNDRPPTPGEISACRPYLDEQLRFIKPVCIVTLGSVATKVLLGIDKGISTVRGRSYDYPVELFGPGHPIKVIPTYHPAALLRNPNLKRDTWEDMKMLKSFLDEAAA